MADTPRIPHVALGGTGLRSTRIALGMAALGRPGYINLGHGDDLAGRRDVEALRDHAWSVLDAAYAYGIRHVDAARSYGRAEEFVAGWLDDRGHGDVVVSSKWGYTYTADWQVDADTHEVKDHSLATFTRQRAATADTLGDHLSLYQVHSATLGSGVLDDHEVLDALGALAASGVTVGLTLSGPDQAATLLRALEVAADGPFTCVQATWNPLEQSVGPALQAAHDAGWGVIVKEAVANGRLTARGDPPGAIADLATGHGVGVDAIAIAAALAQPFVDVVLSGATTPTQLVSNVAAADITLAATEVAAALAEVEDPADYWDRRGGLDWT